MVFGAAGFAMRAIIYKANFSKNHRKACGTNGFFNSCISFLFYGCGTGCILHSSEEIKKPGASFIVSYVLFLGRADIYGNNAGFDCN